MTPSGAPLNRWTALCLPYGGPQFESPERIWFSKQLGHRHFHITTVSMRKYSTVLTWSQYSAVLFQLHMFLRVPLLYIFIQLVDAHRLTSPYRSSLNSSITWGWLEIYWEFQKLQYPYEHTVFLKIKYNVPIGIVHRKRVKLVLLGSVLTRWPPRM